MKRYHMTSPKQPSLSLHKLEERFPADHYGAIRARRKCIGESFTYQKQKNHIYRVPLKAHWKDGKSFYSSIHGSNCENVIGYVPLPVGMVGPVPVAHNNFWVPMATTEGALVASTNRGAAAVRASGTFIEAYVLKDGMTRAPIVRFPTFRRAVQFKCWCDKNIHCLESWFNETTRFGKLVDVETRVVGCEVFMRVRSTTGEAMGMNMLSKGSEHILRGLQRIFKDLKIVSISGNFCSDKKMTAVNWTLGRGKTVCASAEISLEAVNKVLKTNAQSLVRLHVSKNLVGSALAGSLGGFNAHAANIVTAVFIATGQDPAQAVESSSCLTHLEIIPAQKHSSTSRKIRISVMMPSIEVGTIGGGTKLKPQNSLLQMMLSPIKHNRNHFHKETQCELLAKIIASTVLCGELSILSAQAAGHLTSAHLRLNR